MADHLSDICLRQKYYDYSKSPNKLEKHPICATSLLKNHQKPPCGHLIEKGWELPKQTGSFTYARELTNPSTAACSNTCRHISTKRNPPSSSGRRM